MTKFGTVIHTGEGCFNKVMHDPYTKGARPHHSQFWGTSCIRIHSKQILHGAQTRWEENFTESTTPDYIYRVGQKKRGRFVLRLVTLEILIRSASNSAQIKVISFLTLNRNLFESILENKVAPSRALNCYVSLNFMCVTLSVRVCAYLYVFIVLKRCCLLY